MATANATEIRASVKIQSDMRGATDKDSLRYGRGLGCINVVPRGDLVYTVATNGRILAVVPCEGRSDVQHLLPPEVIPQKKAHWPKNGKPEVSLNGKWESSFGTFAQEPENARFPKCADIVDGGQVSAETHLVVTIDPELLMDLATALGREESAKGLTLYIPKNPTEVWQTQQIKVEGTGYNGAFGVIMPMETGDDSERFTKLNNRTNAYAKAEQASYPNA